MECPAGMLYSVLEVAQGVPPFGGYNGLDDFIAAGCDGTTESCVVGAIRRSCGATKRPSIGSSHRYFTVSTTGRQSLAPRIAPLPTR